MCLITFAYNCHPEYSFILLANRDEFYQRPSDHLGYWVEQPNILAGRDREKSGTWLGINTRGAFTAVTNYRDGSRPSKPLRSRGELTANYLNSDVSAATYAQQLEGSKAQFGEFNLLLADDSGLYSCASRATGVQKLEPGIYALSNALLDTPWPKLEEVKRNLSSELKQKELDKSNLFKIMRNPAKACDVDLPSTGISKEREKQLSSIFIQLETYGTRATTILLQKPNGTTRIIEQNYSANGPTEQVEFLIDVLPIGINQK
jgi:uncharacterized protein with NRDE domain